MLLIGEFVPNDDRSANRDVVRPQHAVHTPAGDVFTMKDYHERLKGAGVPHNQDDSHTMGGVAANPRREVASRQ
jgi:hypothetical protein